MVENQELENQVYCSICRKKLKQENYERHLQTKYHKENEERSKNKEKVQCELCKRKILKVNIEEHKKNHSLVPSKTLNFLDNIENIVKENKFLEVQKRFLGNNGEKLTSLIVRYKNNNFESALQEFEKILKNNLPLKLSLSTKCRFISPNKTVTHFIQSHPFTLLLNSKIENCLKKCFNFIKLQIEERYFHGSGLSLDRMFYLDLNIYVVKENRGSLYK